MSTFDSAFAEASSLVSTFRENERHYLSPTYQESEVRKDFIDKFFSALGWDVNHDVQKNPFAQEVKVERGVSMHGSQRRADYAFYIAPNYRDVRFYAEAKKPFGDIATPDNCFQAIRYGWNSQTPVAVLTDFEQFVILDCRYTPDIATAQHRVIKQFNYAEYTDKEAFAYIYYLFSREAVAKGSLNTFTDTLPKKRGKAVQRGLFKGGYQNIDDSFLEKLDEYRDILARAFKNHNPQFDGDTLTEITQRTIDRLVFIRFLEDKLIHPDNLISNFGDKGTAWQDFIAESRRLDGIYNGIVFKKHALLDAPSFKINEEAFADICEEISHVNSPFDFNSIPIHILGSIYERFLGKVIVTTDKRAKIEEKPEVRKAGGVYYTPEYIVRYIVENTVGKLIEGKTPNQIAEMRFADIACGSGSFLLGVYDLLLRYHGIWFNANPDKAKKAGCVLRDDGGWHLSLSQRRHILINNIYGVDIDGQAVEVAQLSLYLKLLEEETTASARQHQMEFHETLLPSLNNNIVCGNSLIGTDILSGELFEPVEEKKLNPMDFEQRFPEVTKRGGFDAIVGNPPYIRPHKMDTVTKEYFWRTLKTFVAKADIYSCFMEKGIDLLRKGGLISFIVPHTWTSLESFEGIRRKLVNESDILSLAQLPKKVFQDATVETCIFAVKKCADTPYPKNQINVMRLDDKGNCEKVRTFPQVDIAHGHLYNFQLYTQPETSGFAERLKSVSKPLAGFVEFVYGFKTADDERFIHPDARYKDSRLFIRSAGIHRYIHDEPEDYVWYVPEKMKANRTTARPGEEERFLSEKIMVARMGKELIADYDAGGLFVKDAMLLLPKSGSKLSLKYLLALINSRLLGYFYREYFITIDVLKNAILALPIRPINFSKPSEEAQHEKIVQLVEQMMIAKKQSSTAQTDKDKDFYSNKCAAIDQKINALVYELYGLTAEEIRIVEGETN